MASTYKEKIRDLKFIKDYVARKKLVRDRLLSERIGNIELQQDFKKFFLPITDTQKETTERAAEMMMKNQILQTNRIIQGLQPLREGIEGLPQAFKEGVAPLGKEIGEIKEMIVRMPAQLLPVMPKVGVGELPPSYENLLIEKNEAEIRHFVNEFSKRLTPFIKDDFDDILRIKFNPVEEKIFFGNKQIRLAPGKIGKIFFDDKAYYLTSGLWELILRKNPDEKKITKEDIKNYKDML